MGVATGAVRPTNNSTQHPARGVRCKSADEVTNKIVGRVDVVVGLHAIKSNKKVIDEFGRADEEFSSILCDDEVLWKDLQHLFIVLQGCSIDIVSVTERFYGLP